MALTNGVLPENIRFDIQGNVPGAELRWGSALRWRDIRNEVHAKYGWWPEVTSAGDAYRSLARQVELFLRNYTRTNTGYGPAKGYQGDLWWRKTANTPSAAVPGTSNHGLARTVDVQNLGSLNQFNPTTTRYNQFSAVATRHGFSNVEGRSIGEPWHWNDTENPDTYSGTSIPSDPSIPSNPPEEDMPLNGADAVIIRDTVASVLRSPEFQNMFRDIPWAHVISGTAPDGTPWSAPANDWLRDARIETRAVLEAVNTLAGATGVSPEAIAQAVWSLVLPKATDESAGVPSPVGPATAATYLVQTRQREEDIVNKIDDTPGVAGGATKEEIDDLVRNIFLDAGTR